MAFKVKKRKKSKGQRGNTTYGHGARKKWKKSGHRGGCGMAGTGKRADQKKSLIIKLYGNDYFGKKGITSRSTAKKVNKVINLGNIEKNYGVLMKKFGKNGVLELKEYKILGDGEISTKLKIKAKAASDGALKKIKSVGGEIEIPSAKVSEAKNKKVQLSDKENKS